MSVASIAVGGVRVTHVRAGSYWWDGGNFFGVVPKTLWSKSHPADPLNRIEAAFNCYVIETDKHRVLVETGGGVRHDAKALERMRVSEPVHLTHALTRCGFDPASIDVVIDTHLHWDHVGGNTVDRDGEVLPALPNARYVTQRAELAHAREQHPRDAVSYRAVNYEPLLASGRMHLLDGDLEVVPGVDVRVVPGHNRDMMTVLVRSGGETWCHLADLVQFATQITPAWVSGFDLFPLEAIDNKTRILTEAAHEGWWCSFGHDPALAFARVETEAAKWRIGQSVLSSKDPDTKGTKK